MGWKAIGRSGRVQLLLHRLSEATDKVGRIMALYGDEVQQMKREDNQEGRVDDVATYEQLSARRCESGREPYKIRYGLWYSLWTFYVDTN